MEELDNLGKRENKFQLLISTEINQEDSNKRIFNKTKFIWEVDLGLVQIGEYENIFIEGFNSNDEVMIIRVVLASEEFSDININFMLNKKNKYNFDE